MTIRTARSSVHAGVETRSAAPTDVRVVPVTPGGDVAPDPHTRERLLQAAIALFERKGYAATSIREVVERAGVTKPVLYYHFGSKEGLLAAVIHEGERHFTETLDRAVARPGSTRDRIIALGEDLIRVFQDHRAAVRVVHALFFGPAEATPSFDFGVFDRALIRAMQAIVEDGIAAGEIAPRPALDVALAITGVIGACAARQLHPQLEPVTLDDIPRILGLVLDGVLQRPSPGDRRS
jgi:TetR/AcrR family transcriptional regulator